MTHLVERGSNQSTQGYKIGMMLKGGLHNLFGRHHHPKVYHLKVITAQHHSHYVFANVMHIALYRSYKIAPIALRICLFDLF